MSDFADTQQRWATEAEHLVWDRHFDAVYTDEGPTGRWFPGGFLNAAVNCLDRHLPQAADRVAIHWEGEPGDRRSISYGALHAEVCAFAAALRRLGVGRGDRVAIYLGWIPEAVVAMLACARLGAVHALIPTALPPEALADRLVELAARTLVTQDGAWRHGVIMPLKARADDALAEADRSSVRDTIVVSRVGMEHSWYDGDHWYHEMVAESRSDLGSAALAVESVPSEHPLLAIYVGHRRGRPTGIVHGTGGFLTAAGMLHRQGFTVDADDVLWCAAEIAWIVGEAHGVYGPLSCGGTIVMYEGMLDTPRRTRVWEIIERYQVNSLVTTPAVMDRLHQWGGPVTACDSLRLVVVGGEPFDPYTRRWMAETMPGALLAEMWGQTELGGAVTVVPSPSGSKGIPDAGLEIVDDSGVPLASDVPGELVLRHPWPATFVALEGPDPHAAHSWTSYPGRFATRDLVRREQDGRLTYLGRRDAVVNISGQVVSLNEVVEIMKELPFVGDVEVLPSVDVSGRASITICVVPSEDVGSLELLGQELGAYIRDRMGGLARPQAVLFVDAFPKELSAERRREALSLICGTNVRGVHLLTKEQLLAAAAALPSPKA